MHLEAMRLFAFFELLSPFELKAISQSLSYFLQGLQIGQKQWNSR